MKKLIGMTKIGIAGCLMMAPVWGNGPAGMTGDEILKKIDGYRLISGSFRMDIRMQDFDGDVMKEDAVFKGFFSGDDRSLLLCTSGRNKGMKVLMKGDDMWVNLAGSKRALRITPMQRLMGEASNGDAAKVSFARDYTGEVIAEQGEELVMELKAKSKGATYQKAVLYVRKRDFRPLKAEFYLLSGKHFKTAYYFDGELENGKTAIFKIRIEDKMNPNRYTVMNNLNFEKRQFPEKYYNVMYLPQVEMD